MRQPHPPRPTAADLLPLLAGSPAHAIACRDGYLPTDTAKVLEGLVDSLQEDGDFRDTFRAALLALAQDPERGWLVMYYLIDLLGFFQPAFALSLVDADLATAIGDGLRTNMAALSHNQSFGGNMYPDGLWGDILRLNEFIVRDYGVVVLPLEGRNDSAY
jgi:hypothetical protein